MGLADLKKKESIDNISVDGIFIADTTAPSVSKLTIAGKNAVEITLDEERKRTNPI